MKDGTDVIDGMLVLNRTRQDNRTMNKVIISILCITITCVVIFSVSASGQTQPIPSWIKNNAKWWADGTISDQQYLSSIQYLIAQGMINTGTQTPTLPSLVSEKLVTEVRTNSSVSVGYYGLGQVSCKSDENLTGGGYYSSEFRELLSVYKNGPSADGKTWQVEMMRTAPHYYGIVAPQFTIYAMCVKIVP